VKRQGNPHQECPSKTNEIQRKKGILWQDLRGLACKLQFQGDENNPMYAEQCHKASAHYFIGAYLIDVEV
jgi:hypothetical protein